jgi:hypothetical protein
MEQADHRTEARDKASPASWRLRQGADFVQQLLGDRLQLGEQVMVAMAIRHGQNSSWRMSEGRQSHPAVTHEPLSTTHKFPRLSE